VFKVGQKVLLQQHNFLHQNHKIAAKWLGPGIIKEIKGHSALVKFEQGKAKTYNLHQLKPFFEPRKEWTNQGEGSVPAAKPAVIQATTPQLSSNLLIKNLIHSETGAKPSAEWKSRDDQAKQLIKLFEANQVIIDPYLRDLHIRVLRSQPNDPEVFTPHERKLYESFEPWERSLRTAGSPIDIPEYRPGPLFRFARRKSLGDLPAAVDAPDPGPAMGPPLPMGNATSTRGRSSSARRERTKKPIPPRHMRLRSAGPAEETGPLVTRRPRNRPAAPTTEPVGPTGPSTAPEPEVGPSHQPGSPEPTPEDMANEPAPGATKGLMQSFKTMGWALLTGKFQNPDGGPPPPSMEFDAVSGSGPGGNNTPEDAWEF